MTEVIDFDPLDEERLGFSPYHELTPITFSHTERKLIPRLGAFGTAGANIELTMDWRQTMSTELEELLDYYDLHDEEIGIYDPVLRTRPWTPEDAKRESREFARDTSLVVPVLDFTPGQAGTAETGFAAARGTRCGQQVSQYIESGEGHSEDIQRARALTTMLMERVIARYPVNIYRARSLEDLTTWSINQYVQTLLQRRSDIVRVERTYTVNVDPVHKFLWPRVLLTGSSAADPSETWHTSVAEAIQRHGIEPSDILSTYKPDWTMDDARSELYMKMSNAVIASAITKDSSSFAAVSELGWFLTHAMFSGQYLLVYMEAHDSPADSPENRQRKLTMAHMIRLKQDFPDLPLYIAKSPKELALMSAAKVMEYHQTKKAMA